MSRSPARRRTKPEPRWRAPVLTRSAWRGPEALEIVAEVEGDAGVLLWRSAINVIRWCEAERGARSTAFGWGAAGSRREMIAGAALDPALRPPLLALSGLLERPASPDVPSLVDACRRIAAWAEPRGFLATALAFAQCAALLAPDEARLAYEVGRLARRRAEYDRAEGWYERAILLARTSKDWRTYARSFSGIGNIRHETGNLKAARRAQLRSYRAARRHSLRELQGDALHGLFSVAVDMRNGTEAEWCAARAFECYGRKHHKLPRLAFDVAVHWTYCGHYRLARSVFSVLLHHFGSASQRCLTLGYLSRVAGELGDRAGFLSTSRELRDVLRATESVETADASLMCLAYGAAQLGERHEAVEAATRALAIATDRGHGQIAVVAEAFLEEQQSSGAKPNWIPCADQPPARFASVLIQALSTSTPAGGTGPSGTQ